LRVKRWQLLVSWFSLLFIYNLVTKTADERGHVWVASVVIAIEGMLAPIQIVLSVLAIFAINKLPQRQKQDDVGQ
jgi:hypothetical protein